MDKNSQRPLPLPSVSRKLSRAAVLFSIRYEMEAESRGQHRQEV